MIGRIRDYLRQHGFNPGVVLSYLFLAGLFAWCVAQFYIPGKGFSYLLAFGGNQEMVRLSKVRKLDYYVQRSTYGYDAQYYVQIAMDPSLQNKQLKNAVDNLPYRARRILFSATAYVLGLGDPPRILQVYALQNVGCWFILAAVLLHWFPPRSWDHLFRWAGVLYCLGVCASFYSSLIDGPSLLLIALGLLLVERDRPWLASAVLALAGLAKETNLLAAASLLPSGRVNGPAWSRVVLRGLLVATPLALWMLYLSIHLGPVLDAGVRNFDLPFVAYVHKWRQVLVELPDAGWPNLGALWSLTALVSLTAQFLFFVLRPQWSRAWWRVGLSYALLMVFLGDAVWEGNPGAAMRVLLPMQLAFNVLVPAGRAWRAVLLAGNLTLLAAPFILQPPASEGYVLGGRSELISTAAGRSVNLQFTSGWYASEGGRSFFWTWARGNAGQTIQNPHPFPVRARLRFSLFSAGKRTIHLKLNGVEVWQVKLGDSQFIEASFSGLRLLSGENRLEWLTDEPAIVLAPDPRELAFVVQNLHLDVVHEWTDTPAR